MPSKSKPTGRKRRVPKIEDFYEPVCGKKNSWILRRSIVFSAARGPGAKALLYEAILQAYKHPGVIRCCCGDVSGTGGLAHHLLPAGRALVNSMSQYNEAKHKVTWAERIHHALRVCDSENDVYRYQGAEYLFIGVDELTPFYVEAVAVPHPAGMRCAFATRNPAWLGPRTPGTRPCVGGKRCGSSVPRRGWIVPINIDTDDYAFIRATIADNPHFADDWGTKKRWATARGGGGRVSRRRMGRLCGPITSIFSPAGRHTYLPTGCSSSSGRRGESLDSIGIRAPERSAVHATRMTAFTVTYRNLCSKPPLAAHG